MDLLNIEDKDLPKFILSYIEKGDTSSICNMFSKRLSF